MKPEDYTKVEIVNPTKTASENWAAVFGALFTIALRTLFVWWAVAAWFPELGITYWQAVLPVVAIRMLFTDGRSIPRSVLRKKA